MPFDLDLSPAEPLLKKVKQVFTPAVATDILLVAGRKVGVRAEALVSPYPQPSGNALPLYYTRYRAKDGKAYQSKFKNLRQQRKVFALLKEGKIPRVRTGKLGQSITSDPQIAGAGLVIARLGSNLDYAPYVIDKILQSHYHMGTWTPIQDDIQRGLPELSAVAVNAVITEVERRIHG